MAFKCHFYHRHFGEEKYSFFFKDFIHLFSERGEGREKEREISMCGCLLYTSDAADEHRDV